MSVTALLVVAFLTADPTAATDPAPAPQPAASQAPAEAAKPAEAQPAPPAEKEKEKATAPKAATAKTPGPKEMSVGISGYFKPFVLAHTWFTWDKFAPNTTNKTAPVSFNYATLAACSTPVCSTFRFRRVELGFSGAVFEGKLQYKVALEPVRALEFVNSKLTVTGSTTGETVTVKQPPAATSILNDATFTYTFEYADITAGQFRIPVSWEGYNGSGKMLFPERALASRTYGDRRDIGLKVTKNFKYFGYGVFLLNGQGQNFLDTNNQKEMALRLEAYPLEGLLLGVVVDTTVGAANQVGRRFRAEIDLRFERGPFVIQGELIRGQDHLTPTKGVTGADGIVNSYAYYVGAGFTIKDLVQPVIRFGHYDPNMGHTFNPATDAPGTSPKAVATVASNWGGADVYEIGLNWFIYKNEAKISASYSMFDWTDVRAEHQNHRLQPDELLASAPRFGASWPAC
ncbi:MAG: porin [Myxococcales bacterium]